MNRFWGKIKILIFLITVLLSFQNCADFGPEQMHDMGQVDVLFPRQLEAEPSEIFTEVSVEPDQVFEEVEVETASSLVDLSPTRQKPRFNFATLELVDIVGDCDGIRVRFREGTKFIGFEHDSPCNRINFAANGGIDVMMTSIINEMNKNGGWQVLDTASGDYLMTKKIGDCHDLTIDVYDQFLGTHYTVSAEMSCRTLYPNGLNAINHVLNRGGKLLSKESSYFEGRCEYKVTPNNYLSVLASISKKSKNWRTVCFAVGSTFSTAFRFDGYENVILKGAGASHSWIRGNLSITQNRDPSLPFAMVDVRGGKNIVISGFRIENLHVYDIDGYLATGDQLRTVSRAVAFTRTNFVHIRDSHIFSNGKQTVQLIGVLGRNYSHSVLRSRLQGSYFIIDANYTNLYVEASHLEQNLPSLPSDEHSLVWTYKSNHFYRSITVTRHTGKSFFSGINNSNQNIRIENIGAIGRGLDSWLQQHPNYSNLRVHLYGRRPSIASYFINPAGTGGMSVGSAVYNH